MEQTCRETLAPEREPGSRWLSSCSSNETYLYCSFGDDCVSLQYNHPLLELIYIPHVSESPPATHVLSLITHTSLVTVLLIVPPNNCLKVCPFSSFYIGRNAILGGLNFYN